jgi:hypothetical protein
MQQNMCEKYSNGIDFHNEAVPKQTYADSLDALL